MRFYSMTNLGMDEMRTKCGTNHMKLQIEGQQICTWSINRLPL